MKADLFTQAGVKKGQVELPEGAFGQKVNKVLLHEFVVMQAANERNSIAKVKTRHERAGSTAKPFKQKGTGRARQGSRKSVQMRGGGRVHGPTGQENWSKDMPKKMRRTALISALSARAEDVFALEKWEVKVPKTSEFVKVLKKLPVKRSVLIVFDKNDVVARKSMRNVPNVKTILASYLNPRDVMQFEKVCFLKDALAQVAEKFEMKKKS